MPNRFTAALDALECHPAWTDLLYSQVNTVGSSIDKITLAFSHYCHDFDEVQVHGTAAPMIQLFFAFLAEIDDKMIDILATTEFVPTE